MVNFYKHVSSAMLMPSRIQAVLSTVVVVMKNLYLGTKIPKIYLTINILNKNFQNISGNYKANTSTLTEKTHMNNSEIK